MAAAIWTAVRSVIISYAVSKVTNKLFGAKAKNTSPTYSVGTLQTQTDSGMAMPIIYGKVKCAGNNLYQDGSGKTVQRLVGFSIGKNHSVSDVRLNDIPINTNYLFTIINTQYSDATVQIHERVFDAPTHNDKMMVLYANGITTNIPLGGKGDSGDNGYEEYNCYTSKLPDHINTLGNGWYMTDSVIDTDYDCEDLTDITTTTCYNTAIKIYNPDWKGLTDCSYTAYMGDGEQEIDSRVPGTTQADKAKVVGGMKYDAYLAMTITASDSLNGSPNITATWEGREVYIWDTTTVSRIEYTNNPAWCILDFMTSIDGCNIPIDDIDIQSFITAALYYQPEDGSRHWELNLILDEKKSRQDWLNDMLSTCRSWRTYQRGKHGILVNKPEPVSQIFTVHKTETIQHDWSELADDYERIIIKYPDPDYEWTKVGAPATIKPPFRNATYNADGSVKSKGTPLAKTIEVDGITNFTQASQHAWFELNKAQTCQDTTTYTCNKRALNRTIGDVVGIIDPILQVTEEGLDYKRYRVMGMTEPQGISIQMTLEEYNEDLYTDELGSVAPVVNIVKLPNASLVPSTVSNIQLTEAYHVQKDGTVISYIAGICAFPDSAIVGGAIVEYSEDSGVSWQYNSTISTGVFVINNVKTGVSYMVRIKSTSRLNTALFSAWTVSESIIITGKDDPPTAVTSFTCTVATGGFDLGWTGNTEADLKGYKLYKGVGTAAIADCTLVTNDLITATSYFVSETTAGNYIFYIVAIDFSLNESVAVSATGTIL